MQPLYVTTYGNGM